MNATLFSNLFRGIFGFFPERNGGFSGIGGCVYAHGYGRSVRWGRVVAVRGQKVRYGGLGREPRQRVWRDGLGRKPLFSCSRPTYFTAKSPKSRQVAEIFDFTSGFQS